MFRVAARPPACKPLRRRQPKETTLNAVMGRTEWLLLLGLSVLWGGSFFLVEVALTGLPPFCVVLARVGLGALALWAVLLARGIAPPRDAALWGAFLVMGLLNNAVPFSLIVWGQTEIASGLAAIINATAPLFTVLLAHRLTRDERLTPARLAGVALGFAGVVVMTGPDALAGLGAQVLAQLAVLGAALSYAFAGIFGRRFRGTPPLVTATGQLTCSTLVLAPIALAVDRPWTLPAPEPATWAALAALALLSTAAAYIVYFRLLASAGATNLLLVTFLIPATALLLGVGVLGEHLETRQVLGMLAIGLGLAAIDGRPLAALRHAIPAGGAFSRRSGRP